MVRLPGAHPVGQARVEEVTMSRTIRSRLLPRGAATAAALMLAAILTPQTGAAADPWHSAGGADWISASGTCDQGARWSIAARAGRGGVLVRAGVRGRPGRWNATLTHNGRPVPLRRGPVPTPNLPGVDQYVLTGRNRLTGQVCGGSLSY